MRGDERTVAIGALEWLALKYDYPLPERPPSIAGGVVVEIPSPKKKKQTAEEKSAIAREAMARHHKEK